MRLFRPHTGITQVPGLEAWAAAQGWQAVPEHPFDDFLDRTVFDVAAAMHGMPHPEGLNRTSSTRPAYRDAYRFDVEGRTVTVADGRTVLGQWASLLAGEPKDAAVCSVQLAALVPGLWVQPRKLRRHPHLHRQPTGSSWFDERFEVFGAPHALPMQALPLIAARDDWVFVGEGYTFGCIRKDPFASVDDVTGLVHTVLDIVATIPSSAARVDRSVDDLVAQIRALDGPEDALAFLQRLSDGDRERLARSGTPLAPLADVRTPEEAMARLQLLPPDQQAQLMALFFRVGDGR